MILFPLFLWALVTGHEGIALALALDGLIKHGRTLWDLLMAVHHEMGMGRCRYRHPDDYGHGPRKGM